MTAGLSAVVRGVRGRLRRRGAAVLHARYPGQPWLADHRWERRGGRDEEPAEVGPALGAAAVTALLLVPFNWGAFWSAGRPLLLQVVTLLFDLAALGVAGKAVRLIARRLRFGVSRLAFARLPFRPGTTAALLLDGLSPRARAHPLRATLRCVEERYQAVGRTRRTVAVPHEVWRAEAVVAPGARRVCFAIPAGVPTTALAARPPRYWELELRAEEPGVDYGARFLVPVYE